jgi:ATP-dependent exoDNAse (exonuclease V) alpha subunit
MSSSAIAGAAYAAGEKLFSEYEQRFKDYTDKKPEVMYSEILLPDNAPAKFYDRATLWNSVESAETSYNSQLARNIVAALPNEIPKEQLPGLVREFCNEHFVKKGMCCDFSIHDKGDGNPHAHILLTLRSLDENGNWMPKCRKEYDLDENGERIKLPSGEYKSHRVDLTDWNKRENCEHWRSEWAKIQNRYYEKNNIDVQIDLRSYERREIDKLPSVHLGPYASGLEKQGVETELGNFNRAIEEHNKEKMTLLELIGKLKSVISEIADKLRRLRTNSVKEPNLTEILLDYLEIRKSGRSDWGFYAKRNCTIKDLKEVSAAIVFLRDNNLKTVNDLRRIINSADKKEKIRKEMKDTKQIIVKLRDIYDTEETYGKYLKSFFKDGYYKTHKEQIDRYRKAEKYLKSRGYGSLTNIEPFTAQYDRLKAEYKSFGDDVPEKNSDKYKELYRISRIVSTVLDDMDIQSESAQPEKKKESVLGKLNANKKAIKENETRDIKLVSEKKNERSW